MSNKNDSNDISEALDNLQIQIQELTSLIDMINTRIDEISSQMDSVKGDI